MAFSRQNDRFYKEWTAPSGALYRITFQPGYHLDPSLSFTDNELPNNIIKLETLKIKGNYDKDIPIGMPKARTLSIDMDLRGFTGDFVDVGTWMLQKKGASQRTVNGRAIDIPNRWWITYESSPGGGLDKTKFDGFMDIKPEDKLPLGNKNFIYKLECIGIDRAVLERIKILDITPLSVINADGSPILSVNYGNYISGAQNVDSFQLFSPTYQVNFWDLTTLLDSINSKTNVMIDALQRESAGSTAVANELYDNITFYERTTNINGSRGSVITHANLLFAGTVTDGTNNIGGQLTVADGTNTSQGGWGDEYDNSWDLLKYLTESSRQKVLFHQNSNFNTRVAYYLKMFEEDTSIKSAADRTLTKAALEFIDDDSGLSHSEKIVSSASTNFNSVSNNDVTKIELFGEGIISQNRFASDLLLHNHPISPTDVFLSGVDALLKYDTSDKPQFPINRLYYQTGATGLALVHETCDIDFGDSITKSNSTIEAWPSFSSDFEAEYKASILKRTKFTGLGNLIAQSTLDLMANTDQYILTATCKSSLVDINDLGNIFTIDIDEIKNDEILITYPSVTTTTVLVSVEEDPIKEISKCKFFIRGTNSI